MTGSRSPVPGRMVVALGTLAALVLVFGDGFGWPGLLAGGLGGHVDEFGWPGMLSGGHVRGTGAELCGLAVLFAGTAVTVWQVHGASPFVRTWGGVFFTWTASAALVAAIPRLLSSGSPAFWSLLIPQGLIGGVLRGALFGCAIAAVVPHGQRVAARGWRPGPYFVLTALLIGPLVVMPIGARLFLPDRRSTDCVEWCMSGRGLVLLLSLMAAYVVVPAWLLLVGVLGALRLSPAIRNWPVIGQVGIVLGIGLAIGLPTGVFMASG